MRAPLNPPLSTNTRIQLDIAKLLDLSSFKSFLDTLYNKHVTVVTSLVTSVSVQGYALNCPLTNETYISPSRHTCIFYTKLKPWLNDLS